MCVSVLFHFELLMRIYNFLVHVTDNLVPVFIYLDHYYHTVYVLIRSQVISSAHVTHKYWDIYKNIL